MSASEEARSSGPEFASAPLMLGFAFIMGVVISVVLPTRREFAEVTSKQTADAYSIAYLSVLTRADPNDPQLALAYARELQALSRWDDALAALPRDKELTSTPALAAETESLKLDLLFANARAKEDGSLREEAFRRAHAELRAARSHRWRASRTRELATLALELEDPALAALYFQDLAALEQDPAARARAFADAGRWLRASGDNVQGIANLKRAAEVAPNADLRGQYVLSEAEALEANEQPCEAADVVRPLANGSNDLALVSKITTLMTSCGRADEARTFGRRLVAMQPESEAELRTQVRRELAAGDPAAALGLLRTLARLHPHDIALHRATARVAEWAGQPQVALEHWLTLVAAGYAPSADTNLP